MDSQLKTKINEFLIKMFLITYRYIAKVKNFSEKMPSAIPLGHHDLYLKIFYKVILMKYSV